MPELFLQTQAPSVLPVNWWGLWDVGLFYIFHRKKITTLQRYVKEREGCVSLELILLILHPVPISKLAG